MTEQTTIVSPPPKPVLVFDGTCTMCVAWVDRLRPRQSPGLECLSNQDAQVSMRFPNLAPEQLAHRVHFIDASGRVYRGAQAILHAHGGGHWAAALRWLYAQSSVFARLAEAVYRRIARHRHRLSAALFRGRR